MPYSATKAQFKKDLASGAFKPKGEGFLSDVADMYMQYVMQDTMAEKSEERAAARMAEKERLAEIKRKALEAEAKEEQAKDYKRKAEKLIADIGYGNQIANPNFMKTALELVYSAEGDYFKALERMETLAKDGRLEVVAPTVGAAQGPLISGDAVNLDRSIQSTLLAIDEEIAQKTGEAPTLDKVMEMTEGKVGRQNFENALEQQMADIRKVGNIPDEAEILDEQMEGLMIKPVTKAAADISEYLKGLTSINAIIGKKAALQLDPNPKLTVDEKTRITTELDKALKEMLDQEEKKAALDKEPSLYALLNKDGAIVPGQRVRGIRVEGGIKREDGTVVEGKYAYLPEDDMSAFIKFNNDNVEEITVQMASDANLARDIIDLRDIIIRNPLTTNRFAIAASDVASYLQQGVTAVTNMMDSNQTYTEQEAIALLDRVEGMTPERKVAEMLKLRVAYGLARLQGSSGMSLSDKELKAQLDSVLAMGKPERAIALLNKQLQTLVSSSETTKSTRVDGFFGEAGTKETFENAVWAKPMDEFIKEQLGEDRLQSYQEALEGKTDYTTASLPKKAVEEPLKVAENWTNNIEVEGVTPKVALDEILANIDGRDISNEEKRRLKAEAYNRVYSEMVNAGITLSFTDFSLIVLGEN